MARTRAMLAALLLVAAVLAALASLPAATATVVGIDYGTDWLKAAIIKPGGVLETVLNRESKRKTAAAVNMRAGVRSYGTDAVSLGMRFPKTTFAGLKTVMGKQFSDPSAVEFRSVYPNDMVQQPGHDSVGFIIDEKGTVASAEELSAMLLAHIKHLSTEYAGVAVSATVITVPPYFTQFERQAILDAAEIADLKVLSLMSDESAVAINYALGKRFPEPKNFVFYDMGAGSTIASLITFKTDSVKKLGSSTPRTLLEISTKAVSSDETLGGHSFDVRLRDHLAQQFMKANKGRLGGASLFDDPRAMARLLKEANRVKLILSANQETFSSVESLFEGIDFRLKITRQEFEEICKDLFTRVTRPVNNVLELSGLKLTDIDAVVLVGGGVRIPAIQAELTKAVGESKIARNVDGDEAAVHGAVYQAASLSAQFRLGLDLKVYDFVPAPIQISYSIATKDASHPQHINVELYNKTQNLGTKKLMSFKQTSDFEFNASYLSGTKYISIAKVKVSGLTDAIEKHKTKMGALAEPPKVKVLFEVNESGVFSVVKAYALFTVDSTEKPASLKDKVLNFFSSKGDQAVTDQTEEQGASEEVADGSGPDTQTGSTGSAAKTNTTAAGKANNTTAAANAAASKKPKVENIPLKLTVDWQTFRPMGDQAKNAARARLRKMDTEDRARELREAARNKLEAFLYRCKEFTWDDDAVTYVTPGELEKFKADIETESEWLEDNSETADSEQFEKHYTTVSVPHARFVRRRTEIAAFPKAISEFKSLLSRANALHRLYQISKGPNDETIYTPAELDSLKAAIVSEETWMNATIAIQDSLKKTDDPVLTTDVIATHRQNINKLLASMDLDTRKRRLPPKPKTTSTTTATASTSTTTPTVTPAASSTVSAPKGGQDKNAQATPSPAGKGDGAKREEL